jgi:hypothetical protein
MTRRSIAPDGTFEIEDLEAGTHVLNATIHVRDRDPVGEWVAAVRAEAGATNVCIQVTGAGSLYVRFHPRGRPTEPLLVDVPCLSWQEGGQAWAGAHSQLRISVPPGQPQMLRFEAEGYEPCAVGPIPVHADRPTVVDVEIRPSRGTRS